LSNFIPSTFREQLREVELIDQRAQAWRKFFTPAVLSFAREINARVISGFAWNLNRILIESDSCEADAIKAIESVLISGDFLGLQFSRVSLMNKHGKLQLPLSAFVETSCDETFVEIYVPKPIAVSVSSFRLEHQLTKYRDRWARLYCVDPRIGDGKKQKVAEEKRFKEETPRETMFAALFEKVVLATQKSLVTFSQDALVDAVIRSNVRNSNQQLCNQQPVAD